MDGCISRGLPTIRIPTSTSRVPPTMEQRGLHLSSLTATPPMISSGRGSRSTQRTAMWPSCTATAAKIQTTSSSTRTLAGQPTAALHGSIVASAMASTICVATHSMVTRSQAITQAATCAMASSFHRGWICVTRLQIPQTTTCTRRVLTHVLRQRHSALLRGRYRSVRQRLTFHGIALHS